MSLQPPPMGTGNARCLSGKTFSSIGLFNAVINITTDILLAFLPTPLIWKLHINLRARVSLVVVLSLGVFASVAAITKQHNAHQFRNPEPYITDAYSIWNFIELDIGIIAAS
ncbi:hypothetical protein HBI81_008980 [Parastagonospora nodorum]|nr:hypothetical protein HBH51_047430 [Parastagonospora nodorum]KAH4095055.1 hypothetical protein HBH48_061720 [Parastagonospora nodorum]KAH4102215.1 hypothetical protein HBH46_128120 [Parastagonospora nodorum]KAH4278913.1 hypothetical protein HBI04_071820 [Parastagonospora nodorum]KAH4302874.1 hypothetical protein HBI01_088950 [Parastagonospora nodorum]